jgi:hopanoid biosynthesis associated protein HpnK
MTRRLIVNGDDFGSSREVNEGVILAHQRGILTSASLVVSGAAFEHAVALAKDNPGLAVGLHLTLADGRPVLRPSEVPHVASENGAFSSSPTRAGLRYFFCSRARGELFNEIEAQFEKFVQSGLRFSHVDAHCHLHVHPVVLDAIVEIALKYGVSRVRVPVDCFLSALPFLRSAPLAGGHAVLFKLLTGRMRRKLRGRGFVFPQRVYGHLLTGRMSREYVLSLLDGVPLGFSELYFHPSLSHSEKDSQRSRELSILMDPEVRSKIDRLGIVLSTYFDLEKEP